MEQLESALVSYLNSLGIGDCDLLSVEDSLSKLPVFLAKSYGFKIATLFNRRFVLLLRRDKSGPTPAQALKHAGIIRERLGKEIIFVLTDLESFNRRRWVENGLSFIVPGKFFYSPMHLVDFRESAHHRVRAAAKVSNSLTAPSQALLLAYLQHSPPCSNLTDWAAYLHYTKMTVSRVRRELEDHHLCNIHRTGKSVTLDFSDDRRSLWMQALPLLRSPVLRTKEVEILDSSNVKLLRAGISGLADLSMLADDPQPTYAMSSTSYKAAFEAGAIIEPTGEIRRQALIEHWSYAPTVLSTSEYTVDRLSLYLSLQQSPDERVQGELIAMLEGIPWYED